MFVLLALIHFLELERIALLAVALHGDLKQAVFVGFADKVVLIHGVAIVADALPFWVKVKESLPQVTVTGAL